MEKSRWRKDPIFDQHEGRFTICVRRLWECWKDPPNDEWLHTCTIITGEPNEFVREIHTRMPVILPEEHHDAWLSGEAGKEVLVSFPADRMKAWPISRRVNSPKK
jgi:putative SOS response-associated peptidase YedK